MRNKKIITVLALMAVVSSFNCITASAEIIVNKADSVASTTTANSVSPEYVYNVIKSNFSNIDKDTARKIAIDLITTNVSLTKDNIVSLTKNYITIGDSNDVVTSSVSTSTSTSSTDTMTTTTSAQSTMRTVKFPSYNAVIGYTTDGKFFGEWKDQEVFGSVKGTWSAKSINGTLTVGNDTFTIKGSYDDNYKVEVSVNGFVLTGYIDANLSVVVLTPTSNQSFEVVPNEVAIANETTTTATNSSADSTTAVTEKDAPSTGSKSLTSLGVLGGIAIATAIITRKKK